MKTFYKICLLLFCIVSCRISAAQQNTEDSNTAIDHLIFLEHQWLAAELKLDTALIAALLDSSFMGISEFGVHSREEELKDMLNTMQQRRDNNVRIDTFEIKECKVNLYSNTAVVTFVLHTFRNENGIPTQRKTRFYDVWVKKDGRWLAVSSQGSIVQE